MSTFRYRGYDPAGRLRHGFLEALDAKDAREKLRQRGVLAEQVDPVAASSTPAGRGRNAFGLEQRAVFYRELAALVKAGIPLAGALDLLLEAPDQERQAARLAIMRDRIREGQTLARALGEASPRVSAFERAAVEAGERSGHLPVVLEQLADYQESQLRLREGLVSALVYPALVVVLAVLVAVGLLGFVVPRLSVLFTDSGVALPALTRFVLAISRALPWALPLFLLILGAGGVGWRKQWRSDPAFRIRWLRRWDGLPVVGPAARTLVALRFTRTLVLLLRGGVNAVDTLELAGASTGNEWVADLVRQQAEAVRHGANLSDALRAVPPLESLGGWIKAGEASGDLAGMLGQAGDRLHQRWQTTLARLTSLLEPVLILVVGAFVLLVALAILLPILSLNRAVL